MELSEKEYNNLYKYSLNIAYKYVGYRDDAFDVAQNAILSLISSKSPVQSPYSWLRTTVKREAYKYINAEHKQRAAIKTTIENLKLPAMQFEESNEAFNLSIQRIKQILSASDFTFFLKYKATGFSLKKLAEQEKTSINTLKNSRRRIQRNLMSAYLYDEGWRRGTRILNYNQYIVITRCINQIIDNVKKRELEKIRNYMQKIDNIDLAAIFEGIDSCLEWNVANLEGNYQLMLVCLPLNPAPQIIALTIQFTKSNYLCIINAEKKQPVFVLNKDAEEIFKFKNKGMISLTTEQIVSILSDKNTDI